MKFVAIASIILAANFYLDYYIFLFSIAVLIPLMFFRPAPNSGIGRLQQIKPIIYILITGTLLTLPLFIPMIRESLLNGFEETVGYDIFVADLIGFIFPHKYHWTRFLELNDTINSSFQGNFWESASFLGYSVLAMTIWSLWKKKFVLKNYFIVVGLLGIILALGAYPHLLGQKITFLPLPYNIIEHVPGLNAARSPGRFVVLTYLALAVFAGVATDSWLKTSFNRKSKIAARLISLIIVTALILDYWSAPFQTTKIDIPGFCRTLKAKQGDFAVLDLPPASREANLRYMYYQTIHQKPICGGQLARSRKSIENYIRRWRGLEMTVAALERRKVKYIILHGDFLPPGAFPQYFNRLNNSFDLVTEENNTALFQVY
jgi:hypothetical protein